MNKAWAGGDWALSTLKAVCGGGAGDCGLFSFNLQLLWAPQPAKEASVSFCVSVCGKSCSAYFWLAETFD